MAKRPRQTQETATSQAAGWYSIVGESHRLWCSCGDPPGHLALIHDTLERAPKVTWPTGTGGGDDAAGPSGAGGGGEDGEWAADDIDALLCAVDEDASR